MEDRTDLLAATEENNTLFVEFDYKGQHFQVHRSLLKDPRGNNAQPHIPGGTVWKFEVSGEDGFTHGELLGEIISDKVTGRSTLLSDHLSNKKLSAFSRKAVKSPGHIPGIVRESIAQILIQGKVDVWKSERKGTLLFGGQATYEALLNDSRLEGEKKLLDFKDPDDGSDRFQYILSKRN